MPGNRHIIIDSKVSLESWHDYSNTNDEERKKIFLKKFLDATKSIGIILALIGSAFYAEIKRKKT